jgi:hypothetical protein
MAESAVALAAIVHRYLAAGSEEVTRGSGAATIVWSCGCCEAAGMVPTCRRSSIWSCALTRRRTSVQTVHQPTEVKAAKIAAVAGVIGALLGAAGVAIPTYLTADRQIFAEDDRARVEYLRGERKATYAQFLLSDSAANELLLQYEGFHSASDAEVRAAIKKLEEDMVAVRIIGSKEVSEIAQRLYDLRLSNLIDKNALDRNALAPADEIEVSDDEIRSHIYARDEESIKVRNEFIDAARLDIGSDAN